MLDHKASDKRSNLMEYDALLQIIKNGSSNKIEFFTSMDTLDLTLQTICGFLNGSGGSAIIGIDSESVSHGIDISVADLEKIALEVNKIAPAAPVEISTIPTKNNKYVIIIETLQGDNKPYLYEQIAYDRLNANTVMMAPEKYNKLLMLKKYV